jgi:hypothetical protein
VLAAESPLVQQPLSILSADLERAGIADGGLLDSVDSAVYTYDDELSYKPHPDHCTAKSQVRPHLIDPLKSCTSRLRIRSEGFLSAHASIPFIQSAPCVILCISVEGTGT